MGAIEVTQEMLAAKFGAIFLHLDERQRRLLMGAEARALGHGGIRLVARAAIVCHKPRSCRPPARTPRSDTPRGKDQLWLSGIGRSAHSVEELAHRFGVSPARMWLRLEALALLETVDDSLDSSA